MTKFYFQRKAGIVDPPLSYIGREGKLKVGVAAFGLWLAEYRTICGDIEEHPDWRDEVLLAMRNELAKVGHEVEIMEDIPLHAVISSNLQICEGLESTWNYHLFNPNSGVLKSLCGILVMQTQLPIKTWGLKSEHIPESYCQKCERIARVEIKDE